MSGGLFGQGVFRPANAPLFLQLAGNVLAGQNLAQGLGRGLQSIAPLLQQRQQGRRLAGLLSDPSLGLGLSQEAASTLAQSPELASRLIASNLQRRGQNRLTPFQRESLELRRQELGRRRTFTDAVGRLRDQNTGEVLIDEFGNATAAFGGDAAQQPFQEVPPGTPPDVARAALGMDEAPAAAPPQPAQPRETAAQRRLRLEAEARERGRRAARRPQRVRAARNAIFDLESRDQVLTRAANQALALIRQGVRLPAGLRLPVTGIFSLARFVPGTPQFELAQALETIRANVGFDQLQALRDASPTGGALGQVSNFENRQLQAVLGSLAEGLSDETLVSNLNEVLRIKRQALQRRRQAFQTDFGEQIGTAGGVGNVGGGNTVNGANDGNAGGNFQQTPGGMQFRIVR